METNKTFLAVVCGATASGKTRLAAELGRSLGGEVISADSMQIYRGMEIATAQPTEEERLGVPHHLIGFLSPSEPFSVADYLVLAREKIAEVRSRGKLPIICGGTGLYISSLLDNIEFDDTSSDPEYRAELKKIAEEKGNGELFRMLSEIDPETASRLHENNLSRVIRALEVYHVGGEKMSVLQKKQKEKPSPYCPVIVMPNYPDRSVLYGRIEGRVDLMLQNGLVDEAREFFSHKDYPTAAQAIGYKELKPFIDGLEPLESCIERLKQSTRRYAKRQLTWWRRDERVQCLDIGLSTDFDEILKKSEKIIKNGSNSFVNML